ncbi:thiol peroxidase [Thalassotalea piscium]
MKLTQFLTVLLLTVYGNNLYASSLLNEELPQRNDLVKAGDKYITLLGHQINIGDQAPPFKVVNETFVPVNLSDFSGKIVLISAVPSLDTGVCSLQTKRFNDEVVNLPEDIQILTISNDLPFAQKRFCKAENIDKIKVLSDSVWRDFGTKYGILIKDMGLLTRSIFIIDTTGKIAYKELVPNISNHPDYEMALATLKALSSEPSESATSSKIESNLEVNQ